MRCGVREKVKAKVKGLVSDINVFVRVLVNVWHCFHTLALALCLHPYWHSLSLSRTYRFLCNSLYFNVRIIIMHR